MKKTSSKIRRPNDINGGVSGLTYAFILTPICGKFTLTIVRVVILPLAVRRFSGLGARNVVFLSDFDKSSGEMRSMIAPLSTIINLVEGSPYARLIDPRGKACALFGAVHGVHTLSP